MLKSALIVFCLTLSAAAQKPKPPVVTPTPIVTAPAAPVATVSACNATEHDDSGFTECESLKIRYLQSLEAPYRVKLQAIDIQLEQFIMSLAPNYPGKTYQAPSQEFPIGHLVNIPPPAAPKTDPRAAPANIPDPRVMTKPAVKP